MYSISSEMALLLREKDVLNITKVFIAYLLMEGDNSFTYKEADKLKEIIYKLYLKAKAKGTSIEELVNGVKINKLSYDILESLNESEQIEKIMEYSSEINK